MPQRSYSVHWPAKAGGLSTAQADRAMQELTECVPWRELTNRATQTETLLGGAKSVLEPQERAVSAKQKAQSTCK